MTLRATRSNQIFVLTIVVCLALISTSHASAQSLSNSISNMPPLADFVVEVSNGQADVLRGIYIPDLLAAPVVQQPTERSDYVSYLENTVTQFGLASKFGATGLLAHNNLAGKDFAHLRSGQEIYLVYGDGHLSVVKVTEILRYRALEPQNIASDFVSLDDGDLLTATKLFSKVYDKPGQVTFQTCIAAAGNPSWGRLFIIATPLGE